VTLGLPGAPTSGWRVTPQWYNPAMRQGTTIPDWGAKDLKVGTVHAAVGQLGLTWKDFEEA
jgi:mRNA interferase HicA